MNIQKLLVTTYLSIIPTIAIFLNGEKVQAQQVVCDTSGQCYVSVVVCNQYGQCWQQWQFYGYYNPNNNSNYSNSNQSSGSYSPCNTYENTPLWRFICDRNSSEYQDTKDAVHDLVYGD